MFDISKFMSPRRSGRALVFREDQLLVMYRKRFSRTTGEWIEYYSIPGGGIEANEDPIDAVVRELYEEMGAKLENVIQVGYREGKVFTHYIFSATVSDDFAPELQVNSEEAYIMNQNNQFIPTWMKVNELTTENLRYYSSYLPLIHQLASGERPANIVTLSAK